MCVSFASASRRDSSLSNVPCCNAFSASALDSVMLGPPVAGVVNATRLAGGGTLQFEDDVYGVQLMIRFRRGAVNREDRDAQRGLRRAYRTGRGFFLR